MNPKGHSARREFRGLPASPGVVIGEAFVIPVVESEIASSTVSEKDVPREIAKFEKALEKTREGILGSKTAITKKLGKDSARIFDAHLLILEDRVVIEDTKKLMRSERRSAESAFFETVSKYLARLREVDDEYLRERESDIRDVKRRVIANIKGVEGTAVPQFTKRLILVAHELTPSMTAGLPRNKVIGVATDVSGKTSHAVIFARSLEIPAVIGLGSVTQEAKTGDTLILDGIGGIVIVSPGAEEIKKYNERVRQFREFEEELSHLQDLPAVTIDGYSVQLSANIEIPEETRSVISHGAKGVGLFRTEFLFLDKLKEPDEDEQYIIYSQVAKKLSPDPLIIRTFDIGGDKYSRFLDVPTEMNPYLGWRAIRISLQHESLFRTQLRAILRATVHGNVKIMFPMITCLEELERALAILAEEEDKMQLAGQEIDESYEIGMMVETPAAALIADTLARRVDFFSIGTNDLIQYTMAADRDNPRVSHLYQSFHPGVIRLVKRTIDAAKERGIWVGVCGELAGNPLGALLLIGLGVDELSVSPVLVPEIKTAVRSVSIKELQSLAMKVLDSETQEEVLRKLKKGLKDTISERFLV
jgi:phosphotransferase system enzyme I (PtsI)